VLAFAWLAIPPAAAQTEPAQLRNPNIVVDYIEPRPPIDPQSASYAKDMATYQRFMKIYGRVKGRQVLEELSAFLSPLKTAADACGCGPSRAARSMRSTIPTSGR